jgi:ABC-type lipoprotein export system ATPase subunit
VTPPAIELVDVTRSYAGPAPLRLRHLAIASSDRVVIAGLDRGAAEMFVLLVTGAALPEGGRVRIDGRDTRDITTDTAWLSSLDRFGIVTDRAVLIDRLPTEANLALPLTLSIDPPADAVRAKVARLADEVGIGPDRLSAPAATLSAEERLRVNLARALALDPAIVLLEHPTATLVTDHARVAFGQTLRRVAERRPFGWVGLSDDDAFARSSGGRRLELVADTGEVRRLPRWKALFR